jgi:hypothetical protein
VHNDCNAACAAAAAASSLPLLLLLPPPLLPLQVKHFDELQSKRARELKTQYAAINSKAATAAGNLAGAAQK